MKSRRALSILVATGLVLGSFLSAMSLGADSPEQVAEFAPKQDDAPVRFRNVWLRPLDNRAFLYEPE